VDEVSDQETRLVEDEEAEKRRKALGEALSVLKERERRIFEARRVADAPITPRGLAGAVRVSRQRVGQIEVDALGEGQKSVKNGVAVMDAPALCRRISFEPSSGGKTADERVAMSALYGNRMRRKGDRSPSDAPKFASYP